MSGTPTANNMFSFSPLKTPNKYTQFTPESNPISIRIKSTDETDEGSLTAF